MSLRQVRYFIAVAKSGSFSAAARQLNVSQPALTLQVKQLEQRLGVALLIRHPRGVELTEAGSAYLLHANEAMEALERADAAASVFKTGGSDQVSLGLTPTSGRVLIADLLMESARRKPPLKLLVREALSDDLWPMVKTAELDAALCYDPVAADTLRIVPLYREDLVLVGSPELVDTQAGAFPLDALSTLPLVLGYRRHRTRRFIEAAAHEGGVELAGALEVEPTRLKREMLVHHGQCSIVPYGLFLDDVMTGQLGCRRIVPPISRTVALILNKGIRPSLERYLVDMIRPLVDRLIAKGELGWRAV
ncbi:MAG TPA: LysR family transcriptional regulator [Stellaceae bacterium]|jgi:LysR family nitrogen assimilation transcriptional regulator|nr:LysR family transcriptional regulator [Stellaceae bacterium]